MVTEYLIWDDPDFAFVARRCGADGNLDGIFDTMGFKTPEGFVQGIRFSPVA